MSHGIRMLPGPEPRTPGPGQGASVLSTSGPVRQDAATVIGDNGGRGMATDSGEITEAIEELRTQLAAAQEYGKDARLQFRIAEVEMEFLVEVRKDAGASGGVRLGVVKLGADAKVSEGTTHRLRLKLDVHDTLTGESATVSGRR